MKTFKSELIKRDGTVVQDAEGMTEKQVLEGVQRLLRRDSTEQLYIFRRHPLSATNELEVHVKISAE